MRFWLARLVGNMANMMLLVALAWHMYDLTGSAWDLGLVGLFQFVPSLVMTLP
ncbi:MAG: MFS transporter, partial [Betaproteobacteria bacterium]|nr:MFS transporter [Betaproteobacteria bacterium]